MFKKKKDIIKNQPIGSAFERMRTYHLMKETSVFEQVIELANVLNDNYPILLNTENVENLADVNYVIAFLTGDTFARGGAMHKLGKETFLFGTKESFEDGTLDSYVKGFGIEES